MAANIHPGRRRIRLAGDRTRSGVGSAFGYSRMCVTSEFVSIPPSDIPLAKSRNTSRDCRGRFPRPTNHMLECETAGLVILPSQDTCAHTAKLDGSILLFFCLHACLAPLPKPLQLDRADDVALGPYAVAVALQSRCPYRVLGRQLSTWRDRHLKCIPESPLPLSIAIIVRVYSSTSHR